MYLNPVSFPFDTVRIVIVYAGVLAADYYFLRLFFTVTSTACLLQSVSASACRR